MFLFSDRLKSTLDAYYNYLNHDKIIVINLHVLTSIKKGNMFKDKDLMEPIQTFLLGAVIAGCGHKSKKNIALFINLRLITQSFGRIKLLNVHIATPAAHTNQIRAAVGPLHSVHAGWNLGFREFVEDMIISLPEKQYLHSR
ncbi:hypothetical protein ACJX0J_032486, partial [Zea mays]